MIIRNKYFGLTHDVKNNDKALDKWRKNKCSKNIHCFDEVFSPAGMSKKGEPQTAHYLVCDACGLMVYIDRIDTEYVEQ